MPNTQSQSLAARDAEAKKAAAEKAAAEKAEAEAAAAQKRYPVPYYNPKVLDEWFYLIGSPYRKKFNNGLFVATNELEEESVRQALRAYGPDKPDRWRGDTEGIMRPFYDRISGFRTSNEKVADDFASYHADR